MQTGEKWAFFGNVWCSVLAASGDGERKGCRIWAPVSCQEALDQQSSHLKKLDRGAIIDLEFVRGLSSTTGEKCLQASALGHLPSKQEAKEFQKCIEELDTLMATELYKFTSQGCQERLCTARRWVVALTEGVAPVLPTNANPWLQDVWARLPCFARVTIDVKNEESKESGQQGESSSRMLVGAEALQAMWPEVQKKAVAKVTLAELDLFVALKYLLPKQTQLAIDKLKTEVLKLHRGTKRGSAGCQPSVSSAEVGSAKKRRHSAAKAAAKAAADSLFA